MLRQSSSVTRLAEGSSVHGSSPICCTCRSLPSSNMPGVGCCPPASSAAAGFSSETRLRRPCGRPTACRDGWVSRQAARYLIGMVDEAVIAEVGASQQDAARSGTVRLVAEVIVVSEDQAERWGQTYGTVIHAALSEGHALLPAEGTTDAISDSRRSRPSNPARINSPDVQASSRCPRGNRHRVPSPVRHPDGQPPHADTVAEYDRRVICCDVGWLSHRRAGASATRPSHAKNPVRPAVPRASTGGATGPSPPRPRGSQPPRDRSEGAGRSDSADARRCAQGRRRAVRLELDRRARGGPLVPCGLRATGLVRSRRYGKTTIYELRVVAVRWSMGC